MNAILTVIFIVSMILSSVIVNKIQRAYMSFIGADVMLYNKKHKFVWIILLGCLIFGLIGKLFGLG